MMRDVVELEKDNTEGEEEDSSLGVTMTPPKRAKYDGLYDSSDEESETAAADTIWTKVDSEFRAYLHAKFPENGKSLSIHIH